MEGIILVTIADFIKIPKTDSYNHLQFGMRYSSYVQWAGFLVPDFPENGICLDDDMREEIQNYTSTKMTSADDVQKLISISISEAISDSVKTVDALINFSLVENCGGTEKFLETIKKTIEKYSEKVEIHPILSFDTSDFCIEGLSEEKENEILKCASSLVKSKFFAAFDFCGDFTQENLEKIRPLVKAVRSEKKHSSFCCHNVKSEDEFLALHDFFASTSVSNLLPEFIGGRALEILKKKNVTLKVSPEIFLTEEGFSQEKTAAFRALYDEGVKIKLCSGKILFTNVPISSFAADLCNSTLFTKAEVTELIQSE